MNIFSTITCIQLLCLAFLAILFLQSGLDKVINYKGNYEWLKEHFAKSPLKGSVGILLPIITVLEVTAGVFCAIGILLLIVNGDTQIGIIGIQISALSILCLFFGQRIAQDYTGAGNLVPYFIVCLIALYLFF